VVEKEGELNVDLAAGAGIETIGDFARRLDGSKMYVIRHYENLSGCHFEKNDVGRSEVK
jgi:hypothetical protein